MIFAKNGTYVENYTAGHLCTRFEVYVLICETMLAKKWVWSTFGCKLGQSGPIVMKLKLDMSCHVLNVYQVSNRYLKACRKNSGKRGWTDGQTDIATARYNRSNRSITRTRCLETCKNPRPTSGWSELTKSCTISTLNFHMAYFSWIPQNHARLKLSCKFGESKYNPC